MIEKGQVYRACDPREGGGRQIRIEQYRPGSMKAFVVGHPDGKRFRHILVSALHQSATTQDGQQRRTGYALVEEVEPT